jgi:hypothetical protein
MAQSTKARVKHLPEAAGRPRCAFWREQIGAWLESGLTQREYCRRKGLSVSSLRWWKWELGRRGELAKSSVQVGQSGKTAPVSPRFLPVRLLGTALSTGLASDCPFEIVLRSGYRIRVAENFDSEALQRLIRAVEASQC